MRLMILYILIFLMSIMQQVYAMKRDLASHERYVNKHIVWSVIVSQSCMKDDYDICRNFAALNKACHKLIEDERPKKKLIDTFREKNKNNLSPVTGCISWNKDFSRCAWVSISDKLNENSCTLTLLGLDDKNSIIKQDKTWQLFDFPVFEDATRPFFTKEGQACFHGYGCKGLLFRSSCCCYGPVNSGLFAAYGCNSVFEYILDVDGKAESRRCFIEIIPGTYIPFSYILNFPFLLKAFLEFKTRTYEGTYNDSDLLSYYDINQITIPDNYTVSKQHLGWKNILDVKIHKYTCDQNITVYDNLPDDLKEAIEKRYKNQQQQILEKK